MKINSTSSLTIQADQELRAKKAAAEPPTTGSNGYAVALFARRTPEDVSRSESQPAVTAPEKPDAVPLAPGVNTIYKCKNCGRRIKLSDAASYYGIPACPACVQACAPFEIVPEQPDSNQA
jgi:hypothetical protein